MKKSEKSIRKSLKELGFNVDNIFTSDLLNDEEKQNQLASIFADVVRNQTNNSTKVNKSAAPVDDEHFYLGFVSDAHSKTYLLEDYLKLLSYVDGKCVVTGDMSNGSNHFHGHDGSMNETLNLSNDILSVSDMLKRYPEMFIGYVEGNHEQWISEGTSLYLGYLACKIAGVDEIYAKNVQLITQKTNYQGKQVPFNFLIVHGEDMPADIVNALKKSLAKACSQNVDAIIFGHTHKLGSASTTVISKNGKGDWIEKQVSSFNPGSLLEASDYADKAGYPANAPFDGSVMHCSVVPDRTGKKFKKCIDIENILDIIPEDYRTVLNSLQKKLDLLENKKYGHSKEVEEKYDALLQQYADKKFESTQFIDGQHLIAINGTSDMYAPGSSEVLRKKIKDDLRYAVSVAKDIPNLSVVLNGDLIFDYNKDYITKKDYCADFMADLQDLCEILKPIADKIVAINYGKMESSIMKVERDKGNGRISKGKEGKEGLKELANYASQVLQLSEDEAYARYDKEELKTKKLAVQNNEVNEANQKALSKAYDDFMKKYRKDASVIDELETEFERKLNEKLDEKRIKEALVKKLRKTHDILDISDENDRLLIDQRFPLSYIDLRMPNENLIGNIMCKLLGVSCKKVNVNSIVDSPSLTKVQTAKGDTKTVLSFYATSIQKFMRDLPAKLNSLSEPPDIIVVNSYANKANGDLQEFTTQVRMSYIDKKGIKRVKDVLIMDSGSFSYSRLLTQGRVPSNVIYKAVDVDPLFTTLVPKKSVNYANPNLKRTVLEKYNYESIHNKYNKLEKMVNDTICKSYVKSLRKYYSDRSKIKSMEFVDKKKATLLKEKELVKSED